MPLVSVLMGVRYPREDIFLLRRSMDSILAQTLDDFEFLICDDGSTGVAKNAMERYARADGRVRLIRPGDKLDLASKLNACLKAAKGAFIARMDDDDFSYPTRLEKQMVALAAHQEIAFVGCNVNLARDGKRIGERRLPFFPQTRDFYMTQPYIHPTLFFRRDAIDAVGGYSENKRQVLCEDYDLLLRLYEKGYSGMNLQEILLDYTIPATAKGNRKMWHRWNEAVTRYERFRSLGLLPGAFPYVVKPLAVGLFPNILLERLKSL